MTNRGKLPSDPAIRDAWNRNPGLTERHRLYAAAYYLGLSERALRVRLVQLGILAAKLPACPTCAGDLAYDFDLDRFFCEACAAAWYEVTIGGSGLTHLDPAL